MNDLEFYPVVEFEKELERFKKKYPTLDADLEVLKKAIRAQVEGNPGIVFQISGLGLTNAKAFKVKKFRCRYLKRGNDSGLRIIYGFKNDMPNKIYLIEMYFKADDDNEDKERIKKYLD